MKMIEREWLRRVQHSRTTPGEARRSLINLVSRCSCLPLAWRVVYQPGAMPLHGRQLWRMAWECFNDRLWWWMMMGRVKVEVLVGRSPLLPQEEVRRCPQPPPITHKPLTHTWRQWPQPLQLQRKPPLPLRWPLFHPRPYLRSQWRQKKGWWEEGPRQWLRMLTPSCPPTPPFQGMALQLQLQQ